jgi:hypothetical protein
MKFGMLLHDLWHRRLVLVLSLLIAAFAAVFSAYRISLSPPGVQPRAIGMAAASTQVLVDNPNTIVLDLNQGSYQLQQMAQSATLLGSVMVSLPVREDIARRVGIPVGLIQTTAPATPQFPQAVASPQSRKTTDLLASNNQYRINIQANPTVPIVDIYTEAHSVVTAKALANAAVDGLRDYLSTFAQDVPAKQRVRIEQLGYAEGGAVTGGLRVEVLALVFFFGFALCAAALLLIERVRRGWKISREATKPRTALSATNGKADLA